MKLIEVDSGIIDHYPLNEMANLRSDETGLAYTIWIGRVEGNHGPIVKVSNIQGKWKENDNFVLSIEPNNPEIKSKPETVKISSNDVTQVKKWIITNYDDLMVLWWMFERNQTQVKVEETDEILTMDDFFDRLQKV
jgi:hypothetical protein